MAVSPSVRHFALAVVFYHGFPIPSIKRGALHKRPKRPRDQGFDHHRCRLMSARHINPQLPHIRKTRPCII